MKLRQTIFALTALLILSVSITACSPAQTLARAENARELGVKSESIANKIYDALEKYNAGMIEEGVFADMIVAWLPEDKSAVFEQWLSLGTDIRIAATDIADSMMSTASKSFTEADKLVVAAANQKNKLDGFWSVVKSGIAIATDPEGVIIGGLGALVLLINKRKKSETDRADEAVAEAGNAKSVAENLVLATEAFKSTAEGAAAWSAVGKKIVSSAQSAGTEQFVKDLKATKPKSVESVS